MCENNIISHIEWKNEQHIWAPSIENVQLNGEQHWKTTSINFVKVRFQTEANFVFYGFAFCFHYCFLRFCSSLYFLPFFSLYFFFSPTKNAGTHNFGHIRIIFLNENTWRQKWPRQCSEFKKMEYFMQSLESYVNVRMSEKKESEDDLQHSRFTERQKKKNNVRGCSATIDVCHKQHVHLHCRLKNSRQQRMNISNMCGAAHFILLLQLQTKRRTIPDQT